MELYYRGKTSRPIAPWWFAGNGAIKRLRPTVHEARPYAKEPVVHPRTRGRFRTGAGRDGEAADQPPRPGIRTAAAQHCASNAVDLRNEGRCIAARLIRHRQPRGR